MLFGKTRGETMAEVLGVLFVAFAFVWSAFYHWIGFVLNPIAFRFLGV